MNQIKVDVPEGQSGDWKVERFTITEDAAKLANLQMTFSGHGYRWVEPGTYTRLMRGRKTIMSDTRAEVDDHWWVINEAKGQVLINGLGLGVVVQGCLEKEEVEHLTVVEISEDVIKLVGKHYINRYNGRLSIVQADAFTFTPTKGVRFNAVWHDVWDDICLDNWEQYKALHRKYGRRCDWQGSWCRELLQQMLREERAQERIWGTIGGYLSGSQLKMED